MHRIRYSSQVHAIVLSSTLQLGVFRIMPLNRVSDRLMVSHTTCRSHLWFVPAGPCFALHFKFVICCCQVCLCHPLPCVCVLLCLSRLLPRRQSSFPQFFFCTHRNGFHDPHNRTTQRRCLLRYVRLDLTFVHSSVVRTSTFLQALPGIELSGLQGSPSPIFRTSVSQESLQKNSSRHSAHQCFTWYQQT